jgi:hypothetical protein
VGSSGQCASATVEHWNPPGIASELYESHAAFDPLEHELLFVRSTKDFSGWRILQSKCTAQGWSAPVDAPFAGPGLEADPYFTPDGRSVYFISTRATGGMHGKDLDIWRVDRNSKGAWGQPVRLPEPLNSSEAEWFPHPASDGWLYFGSNRAGGYGGNDIWRARKVGDRWAVENVGPAINTDGDEYEPLPSPDGATLIVATADGLYESKRINGTWSPRIRLGAEINVNGTELGALYSPSGHSLMFARDTGEAASGEFFIWRIQGREEWPAPCGVPRGS